MAILSKERKKEIIKSESRKKFHDKKLKVDKAFQDELERIASLTVPKWYTDEIVESRMVHVSNSAYVSDMPDDPNYQRYRNSRYFGLNNCYPCIRHKNLSLTATKKLINKRNKVLALKKEIDAFESKLRQILASVNTDKKIREFIPELSEYVGVVTGKCTLPVPTDKINEFRKLLKKEKKCQKSK